MTDDIDLSTLPADVLERLGDSDHFNQLTNEAAQLAADSLAALINNGDHAMALERCDTIHEWAPQLVALHARQASTAAIDAERKRVAANNVPRPEGDDGERWQPTNLAELIANGYEPPRPTVGQMEDGQHLFYPGAVNGVHGPSGDGKSWLMAHAVAQTVRKGQIATIVDYEDTALSWAERLTQLGLEIEDLAEGVVYFTADGALHAEMVPMVAGHSQMVVIDSVGEAMAANNVDPNRDHEVASWFRNVPKAISLHGPAVVVVDHTTKINDSDLWAAGSFRKRAAISGSAFATRVRTPFSRGAAGRVSLVCAKDRHGTFRRGDTVADLVMTKGGWLTLYPADDAEESADATSAAVCQRAMRLISAAPTAFTKNGLEKALRDDGLKMRTKDIVGSLDVGVTNGWLAVKSGPKNSQLFTLGPKAEGA